MKNDHTVPVLRHQISILQPGDINSPNCQSCSTNKKQVSHIFSHFPEKIHFYSEEPNTAYIYSIYTVYIVSITHSTEHPHTHTHTSLVWHTYSWVLWLTAGRPELHGYTWENFDSVCSRCLQRWGHRARASQTWNHQLKCVLHNTEGDNEKGIGPNTVIQQQKWRGFVLDRQRFAELTRLWDL